MVYSTCSLNPVENEAVLADAMSRTQGGLEILNVRSNFPLLKTRPGLLTWKVMDRNGAMYSSHDEVVEDRKGSLVKSLFPPTLENGIKYGLENSMRVLPHDQDTGGFFICVLKKVKVTLDLKVEPIPSTPDPVNLVKAEIAPLDPLLDVNLGKRKLEQSDKDRVDASETKKSKILTK